MSVRRLCWLIVLSCCLPLFCSARPLAANLRGQVMILVYHNFGPAEARWTRSYAGFDRDLARLDAAGYRPITLRQYITGDFDLPTGTSPVVLTFDDGSKFQLRFTPDGQIDPDCAVAHWIAFAKAHPDFPVHGTFFVNPGDDVFSQRAFIQKKLDLLVQMGSEIGNHTYNHPNLSKIPEAEIEKQIGLSQFEIDRWLPKYPVVSLALPYGIFPKDKALTAEGSWTGTTDPRRGPVTVRWHNLAVVKVGSGPANSPLVAGLNGASLPRIQAFDPKFGPGGIDTWMRHFDLQPGARFVSDGQRHAAGSLPAR